ncbi:transposase [Nostoc sp. FACHB-888]|uniref:transposase n=1 Tax=Nostoc sp. FACHB-888 TaxID=2692842 RepID=UPI00321FD494
MSKAYSSNLTQDQWELLEPLIPVGKTGGRPRVVEMWRVINAIFYVLTLLMYLAKLTGRLAKLANGIHILQKLAKRWNMGKYP